jgi:folylpolyglutamate synthase/dihydrofolate synthase
MATTPPDPRGGPHLPGEPGVEMDARLPFRADHDTTRWLFALNRKGIRPGLKRVQGLLADLGHPENDLTTIVISGTNGKGSTTRLLAGMLQGIGLNVATYTSPHLLSVYERLHLGPHPVAPDLFRARVEELRPSVERHQASWFETLTATAVSLARDSGADVFCCETGLGGRLDASNALPAVATLLTSVSLDHQSILGDTVEEIAAEKLGLLKDGVPFFTSVKGELKQQAFAASVLSGAPPHFLDELVRMDTGANSWSLTTRTRIFENLPLLSGPSMRSNAALAILTLEELANRGVVPRLEDPAPALNNMFLPGRFQTVLSGPDWIVDTAHNPDALVGALKAFLDRPVTGARHVLFGGMHDKDPGVAVGELLCQMDTVTLTTVGLPRSRNPEQLQSLMDHWGLDSQNGTQVCNDLGEALDHLATVDANDAVLACGSCFLVGELLWRLGYRDLEETRQVRAAAKVLPGREGCTE